MRRVAVKPASQAGTPSSRAQALERDALATHRSSLTGDDALVELVVRQVLAAVAVVLAHQALHKVVAGWLHVHRQHLRWRAYAGQGRERGNEAGSTSLLAAAVQLLNRPCSP